MSALTDRDLAAARELCESATAGPYLADLDMFDNEIVACISNATTAILFTGGTDCVVPHAQKWTQELQQQSDAAWERAKESQALRDAQFLAASGTLVPSLLDDVERLRTELADSVRFNADLAKDIGELESCRMWHEAATERERIRSLLAEACDHLESEGLDETAARLRQQGGAFDR